MMVRSSTPIPGHIPTELVRTFDLFAVKSEGGDLMVEWKKIQDSHPPLFYTPLNGGHWVPTRAHLIERILKEHDLFSSATTIPPMAPGTPLMPPIQVDPPNHFGFRSLINPWFGPKAVQALGERVRVLAIELIEGFYDRGECEFISEFAQYLPIDVFLTLAGLPLSDRKWLLDRAEVIRISDPISRAHEYSAILDYLRDVIAQRQNKPGDDMISRIIAGTVQGRPMNAEEILGESVVLLLGGLDTVSSMLGFIARFLATHPDYRHQLQSNPTFVPRAVEELVRRHSVASTPRVARQDIRLDDVLIKGGDRIWVATWFHALDEIHWPDPLAVELHRDTSGHYAFGNGIHRCPGASLARSEITIFLGEWLQRIPEFQINPTGKAVSVSGLVNAVVRLPLAWNY